MNDRNVRVPLHSDGEAGDLDSTRLREEYSSAPRSIHEFESELTNLRQDIHRLLTAFESDTLDDNALELHDTELSSLLAQLRTRTAAQRLAHAHAQYLRQRLRDLSED